MLKFAPIMPAFCSLLLPSYFSKNYAGKIGASLSAILSVDHMIEISHAIMKLWCGCEQSMWAMMRNSKSSFIGLRESFLSIVMNVQSKLGQVIALQRCFQHWLACYLLQTLSTTVVFDKKDQTQSSYILLRFWKQIDNTI